MLDALIQHVDDEPGTGAGLSKELHQFDWCRIVDPELSVRLGAGFLKESAADKHGGIVDQDVCGTQGGSQFRGGTGFGKVAADHGMPGPGAAEPGNELFRLPHGPVAVYNQFCAVLCESACDGGTDSDGAAGDEYSGILNFHCRFPF